jgi:hypothetical protein
LYFRDRYSCKLRIVITIGLDIIFCLALTFQVCDDSGEDPNCSDSQYIDLSVYDHLHYLNVYEDCTDGLDSMDPREVLLLPSQRIGSNL